MDRRKKQVVFIIAASCLVVALGVLVPSVGIDGGANTLDISKLKASDDDVIAVVRNRRISKTAFERGFRQEIGKRIDLATEANRRAFLDSMVEAELLAQEAESMPEILANNDIAAALEAQRRNLFAMTYAEHVARTYTATADDVKAEYDKFVKNLGNVEFNMRQIVFEGKRRDVAMDLFRKIDTLRAFDEAAKSDSGKSVDLGWIAEGQIPPALLNKLRGLNGNPGHVLYEEGAAIYIVRVDAQRKVAPPDITTISSAIESELRRSAGRTRAAKMRVEFAENIEVFMPPIDPKAADSEAPTDKVPQPAER